jgi:hypothetical protein
VLFEAVLWRDRKLLRFYENTSNRLEDRSIGTNAEIPIDLASVRVKDSDVIILTSLLPNDKLLSLIEATLIGMTSIDNACTQLAQQIQSLPFIQNEYSHKNPLIFILQVGPPTIVLRNVIFNSDE